MLKSFEGIYRFGKVELLESIAFRSRSRRALFVLSQSRNDRAIGIIGNVARTNSNPDLQQRAIRTLGQSNSPEATNTLVAVYKADPGRFDTLVSFKTEALDGTYDEFQSVRSVNKKEQKPVRFVRLKVGAVAL